MKINKKIISQTLLILLAAGVFIVIGLKIDWQQTANAVRNANLNWLIGATVTMLYAHYLRGWRWNMLTEPAGYPLNKIRAFYTVMIGYLVNVATSRGGEFVRCAMAAKSEKAPVPTLVGSVVTERIVDLLVLMSLCLLCLALQFQEFLGFFNQYIIQPAADHYVPLMMLLVLGTVGLQFIKKRQAQKPKTEESTSLFSKFSAGLQSVLHLKQPALFIASSYGIWLGYWLSTYCTLQSLDITAHLTLANALGVVIFSSLGVIIPIPGGAGVWGTVSYGLTLIYGLADSQANTYGIFTVAFSNILMIVFGAIAYLLFYLAVRKIDLANDKA
ncbi:MAG: flippase-like domain-containing protein [Bacteroidetes bacterium]|nr:flippase-like domain-containing protein [Bacteroidota bacterium]